MNIYTIRWYMVNNRIGNDGIISIQIKQVHLIGYIYIKFLNTLREKEMPESWSLKSLT